MDWTELTIYTSGEGMEPLKSKLTDIGITGFVVEDPEEMLRFIEENSDSWDMIEDGSADFSAVPNIKVYISDDEQGRDRLKKKNEIISELRLSGNNGFGTLETECLTVRDEDWENSWKVHFRPFKVGEKLYIKPVWESIDDDEGRIVIETDPASSFGSGQHETTRLCLEALEKYVFRGAEVIDVGTGSGILASAAALLGAGRVIGTDIEENSVITARNTAAANSCSENTEFFRADLLEGTEVRKADIIIGNLFSNIIVRLAPQAAEILSEGGLFITSGIISDSLNDVLSAYEKNGFEVTEIKNIGEWHLTAGRKLPS